MISNRFQFWEWVILLFAIVSSPQEAQSQAEDTLLQAFSRQLDHKNALQGDFSLQSNQRAFATQSQPRVQLPPPVRWTLQCILTIQMIEEQRLKHSTPLSRFFPKIPGSDSIHLLQLMQQQTSLPAPPAQLHSRDDVFQYYRNLPAGQNYHNSGGFNFHRGHMLLLESVIKQTGEQSFCRALQRRVLDPLQIAPLDCHRPLRLTASEIATLLHALFRVELIRATSLEHWMQEGAGLVSLQTRHGLAYGMGGRTGDREVGGYHFPNLQITMTYAGTFSKLSPRCLMDWLIKLHHSPASSLPTFERTVDHSERMGTYRGRHIPYPIEIEETDRGWVLIKNKEPHPLYTLGPTDYWVEGWDRCIYFDSEGNLSFFIGNESYQIERVRE